LRFSFFFSATPLHCTRTTNAQTSLRFEQPVLHSIHTTVHCHPDLSALSVILMWRLNTSLHGAELAAHRLAEMWLKQREGNHAADYDIERLPHLQVCRWPERALFCNLRHELEVSDARVPLFWFG
jgi:hypothetical protein